MKNLYPAPIDGKNVTDDWISEVFDNCGDAVTNGNGIITGFVKRSVVCCSYFGNTIFWQVIKGFGENAGASYDELVRRLKERDNERLVVEYDDSMKGAMLLVQKFYWPDE